MAKDSGGHGSENRGRIATGYNDHYSKLGNPIREKRKQDWETGSTVNVGFMKGLKVTGKEATPYGHHYSLEHPNGTKYEFHPHYGISKL